MSLRLPAELPRDIVCNWIVPGACSAWLLTLLDDPSRQSGLGQVFILAEAWCTVLVLGVTELSATILALGESLYSWHLSSLGHPSLIVRRGGGSAKLIAWIVPPHGNGKCRSNFRPANPRLAAGDTLRSTQGQLR
jgi:hypothetical protein